MIVVFGSLAVLFTIALVPKIPKIGGSIQAALLGGGLTAGLLSALTPLEYFSATVDGIDRLAWVIALSITGSIYAETQVRIGAMDTTLRFLRIFFGNSPRGLIAATFVTLTLAGSLLGDAIAAATVIGFLVIHTLAEMKLKPFQIGAIILLGASLGSIMPPISQAVFLSASLVETDPIPVIQWSYLTVTVGLVLAILQAFTFVRGSRPAARVGSAGRVRAVGNGSSSVVHASGGTSPNDDGAAAEAGASKVAQLAELTRERWKSMLPLAVLGAIVLLKTTVGYDIFTEVPGLKQLSAWLTEIPILRGLAFPVVMAIVVAALVSFGFARVRREPLKVLGAGLKNVRQTVQIQLCAAFMIGIFYASGAVDTVSQLAQDVNGGGVAMISAAALLVIGMLTGSQTAAQTVVVPFASPILENAGVDPTNIALAMSHIAGAAQNLPPVGLTAFVVCGLVGGTLKTKVDPVRVMILALPNSLYFIGIGLLLLFI